MRRPRRRWEMPRHAGREEAAAMSLEFFVAWRYLRPKRGRSPRPADGHRSRPRLLSVVAAIAVLSFAAGVAALILSLAVMDGFRDALQNELVGATAQINLLR